MKCKNCGEEIGVAHVCWKCLTPQDEEQNTASQGPTGQETGVRETDAQGAAAQEEGSQEEAVQEPDTQEGSATPNAAVSDEQPKNNRKKHLIYGGVAAAALALIAVIVFCASGGGVNIRQPGAWLDFPYLATLIDEPEVFVRAVNCDALEDAYDQAKEDGSWDDPITVPIDIDELEENGAADESGLINPGLRVMFDAEGKITYFQVVYIGPALETVPIEADGGNYFPHMIVAGELGGRQFYGISNMSDETILDYAETVRKDCEVTNSFIHDAVFDAAGPLTSCGIDPDGMQTIEASTGRADWTDGYLLSCSSRGYAARSGMEIPVISSGTAYSTRFTLNGVQSGEFLYQAEDLNFFSWLSNQTSDLSVQNYGAICIGFIRDGYVDESQTAQTMIAGTVSESSMGIWTFEDGAPTDE